MRLGLISLTISVATDIAFKSWSGDNSPVLKSFLNPTWASGNTTSTFKSLFGTLTFSLVGLIVAPLTVGKSHFTGIFLTRVAFAW